MSGPLRRAGRGRLADGVLLTWSVAQGSRGRRWRGTTTRYRILEMAALLEVGLDGRPTRLELATVGGLLTLHPSDDGTELHGNVVRAAGIDHLAFAWGPEYELWIDGLALAIVAAVPRLAASVGVGEAIERPAIRVDAQLRVDVTRIGIHRLELRHWQVTVEKGTTPESVEIDVDADGCPAGLADGRSWPLELG